MGLPTFTNLDVYYGDSSQYGDYQYTALPEIVNDFIMSTQDGDWHANAKDSSIIYQAKRGIQKLYFDVAQEIIAIELELNPSYTIPLPHDYINYVRISWVDQYGKLHPMAVDKSSNLSQAYLQDENYNLLFDGSGDILTGSHIQDTGQGYDNAVDNVENYISPDYTNPHPFNLDRSRIFKNGSYRIDKTKGVIQFSSTLDGKTIVLEYISDGLYQRADNEIKVHKFCEGALMAYIYYKLIERGPAPEREKMRAEKAWYNLRRIAKRRMSPLNKDEIRQVLKGNSRWIKD